MKMNKITQLQTLFLSLCYLGFQATGQYTSLGNIAMEYSTSTVMTGNLSTNVENCSCPIGYTGLSCERCSPGYTRAVPYGSATSECVPCNCYGHSETCNPDNGICQQCSHFTTGNFVMCCKALLETPHFSPDYCQFLLSAI